MRKYLLPENGNFYKANLHCHTTVTDGELTPEVIFRRFLVSAVGHADEAFPPRDALSLRHRVIKNRLRKHCFEHLNERPAHALVVVALGVDDFYEVSLLQTGGNGGVPEVPCHVPCLDHVHALDLATGGCASPHIVVVEHILSQDDVYLLPTPGADDLQKFLQGLLMVGDGKMLVEKGYFQHLRLTFTP